MQKRIEYYYLPKKFHRAHDFCEFIITQIEKLIVEKRFDKLRKQKIKFSKEQAKLFKDHVGHIYDFMEINNMKTELNHSVQNTLLNSLIMDTCYFLQEGYLSVLKMRMSVSFTLFRKPFLETLNIYMRILIEEDFIERFNNEEKFDPSILSHKLKNEYIEKIDQVLQYKYVTSDVFDHLYNKEFRDSLYLICNQAIHLYTDRNSLSYTGKQNLNFIFNGSKDISEQWEYIYTIMPMLLNFLADAIDLCVMASTSLPATIFVKRSIDRDMMRKKCNLK